MHDMPTQLLAVAAVLLAASGQAAEPADASRDRVWVGPMPFDLRSAPSRTLRRDFLTVLADADAWPTVLAATDVFKSYIMILPRNPVPGKTVPELSDAQLAALISFINEHKLKVAFEVGGLRIREGEKARKGEWGKQVAANELTHLNRWLDAGGRIDYLSTDHAVMMNLGHRCYKGTDCGLTLEETVGELADYFKRMSRRIPGVRLGVIESLGFFHVTAPDGTEYPRTVPKLPVWRFEDFLDCLLSVMERRGLQLDHLHIDFGFMGVQHDARRQGKRGLDFGRVLGVERLVQSRGIRAGAIVNAFHDRSVRDPDSDAASRQAHERTLSFFRGYVAAGGRADHLVVQTWQPFPDRTGPEHEPGTVLNIAKDILGSPEFGRLCRKGR